MFPPTLASSGGRGLSRSFRSPLRFGLRAFAWEKKSKKVNQPVCLEFVKNKMLPRNNNNNNIECWYVFKCALNIPSVALWRRTTQGSSCHFLTTSQLSCSSTRFQDNLQLKALPLHSSFIETDSISIQIQMNQPVQSISFYWFVLTKKMQHDKTFQELKKYLYKLIERNRVFFFFKTTLSQTSWKMSEQLNT